LLGALRGVPYSFSRAPHHRLGRFLMALGALLGCSPPVQLLSGSPSLFWVFSVSLVLTTISPLRFCLLFVPALMYPKANMVIPFPPPWTSVHTHHCKSIPPQINGSPHLPQFRASPFFPQSFCFTVERPGCHHRRRPPLVGVFLSPLFLR